MQSPDSRRSLHCHNSPRGQDDPFTGRNNQAPAPVQPAAPSGGNSADDKDPFAILMTTVRNQIRHSGNKRACRMGEKLGREKIKQAGVSASTDKKGEYDRWQRSKRRKEQQDCGT